MRSFLARRLFLTVLAACLAYPACGESPARLLADLVPGPGDSSSFPRQAVEVDGALYFVATHPLTGREVWRWEGSAPARPLEVCPGRCSSDPRVLRPFGERLVFVASGVGDDAREALWITDGGRPRWLHDVGVWDAGLRLAATSSSVYFTVRGADGGSRLLRSDGTVDGTAPIAGTESWDGIRSLTAVGGRLFVVAEDAGALKLWTLADGGSPVFLKTVSRDSRPGWTDPFPQRDGTIWFQVAGSGCALWSSDGTSAGTRLLTDTLLARGGEGCGGVLSNAAFLDNGVLIFVAWRSIALEDNLWRSDGTDAGTFAFGRANETPVVAVGDRAFFGASGIDVTAIAVTDGTAAGTQVSTNGDLLHDPSHLIAFEDGVVFAAYNTETGRAVWRTDGTLAGTRLVADVDPEVRPTLPLRFGNFPDFFNAPFAVYGERLVFPVYEETYGEELWITDGTADGTALAADVNPGVGSSDPREITAAWDPGLQEEVALLAAGSHVYRTAGEDVLRLSDFADDRYSDLTLAGDHLFAQDSANELWSFALGDGSVELLTQFACPARGLAELDGRLYLVGLNSEYFLYASDGTAAGTVQVAELPELVPLTGPAGMPPLDLCPPMPTARLGGRLYILAPHHLLTTDGTGDGTFDLLGALGCMFGTCNFSEIAEMGGALYFTMTVDGETGLWRGSGEVDDRSRILSAGGPEARIRGLTVAGDRLFFLTRTAVDGETLWTSDGTPGGTRMLRSLTGAEELTAVAPRLFFSADDGVHGQELWTSDGTADGTYLVTDIAPGPEPSLPRSLREIDGRLVFAADDGVHGQEVWTSDGTVDGTRLVADVEAELSSSPRGFTAVGDDVLFNAGTSAEGFELWALPRDALAGPEEPEEPPCPDDTACLAEGRFTVTVHWQNPRVEGAEGDGHPLPFSDESSLFWFFSEGNVELIVKILDGRRQNGHFWVFYGGLSDVEYRITVTDTETGRTRTYHNAPGEICGDADVRAFAADGP